MKIGFSFSKCLRDIYLGVVKESDVVCIIARTRMDREHIAEVIAGYQGSYSRTLQGMDYQSLVDIAHRLWDEGRIHQPSQFSRNRQLGVNENYVWMDLCPTRSSENENVIKAWDNYQLMLKMCEGKTPSADAAEQQILNPDPLGI